MERLYYRHRSGCETMMGLFRFHKKNREPMDYIDGKPVYPNRRTRKALKEVEEFNRGERKQEKIDLREFLSKDDKH